jgi:predicted DNA-binding transcriptional regulator AlpA
MPAVRRRAVQTEGEMETLKKMAGKFSADLMKLSEVQAFFGGVHHSTIYRWADEGKIPAGQYIGPNTVRWERGPLVEARQRMLAQSDSHRQARADKMRRKMEAANV